MWSTRLKLLWQRVPLDEPRAGISPLKKDPPTGAREPRQIDGHQGGVTLVAFLPDGKQVISGGNDGTIRRMNALDGHPRGSNEQGPVNFEVTQRVGAVSKDGRWIVLADNEGQRGVVYGTETRQRVVESAEQHEQKITALDVSADSAKFASGSQDGAVIVWCLETGRRLAGPFKQGHSVWSVKFSPTGERLASAGWDFSVRLWNFNSDSGWTFAMRIPIDPVYSLAWSNDGNRLFAGDFRGSIMCFDVANQSMLSKWTAHVDAITTLCISHNGRFLVSASNSECAVRLWDLETHTAIGSPLEHTGEVFTAAISPDDSHLVSGGNDGLISVWNLRKVIQPAYFLYTLPALLVPQSHKEARPILTMLSNTAYEAWKGSDLVKAEDLLSSEIADGESGCPHIARANRALLRVRMQHWQGALEDAQASIDLGPSLAALVAKSFALCGQAKSDLALETIDSTLRTCEPAEQDFVTLVKSIILFELGHREEGENYVRELVLRTPGAKQTCALVQAKMLAIRADDATRRENYPEAIQLLTRAQDLGPLLPVPEISTISLITGWVFDGLRFSILQKWMEACHATGRIQEALSVIHSLDSELKGDVKPNQTVIDWLADFKSRCVQRLESQGDSAMGYQDYDVAIIRYTEALNISPSSSSTERLFVKRSRARVATRSWENALKDADEVIMLNSSSHEAYDIKRAVLHGLERYEEAIAAFETMLSILESSSDPETQRLRHKYTTPFEIRNAIQRAFKDIAHNCPFRLIDTNSGHLYDPGERGLLLGKDPALNEFISSATAHLDKRRIKTFVGNYSRYVMLSHRWEGKEPEIADVRGRSVYDLDPSDSPPIAKLQKFCRIARDAGFRWAWSDTCCIHKEKDVEFANAINSMFRWYRGSALTIVYLSGVYPESSEGTLKDSAWMTRGWTLQELLAPPVIRFYYADWTPYLNDPSFNHKGSNAIMEELEGVTGVATGDLCAFRPGSENIRLKLRLASKRKTTIPVDVAYCLFGIFDVTMPIIHGESPQHALGRMLQSIVARSGDVSCLSWVGKSSNFNSAIPETIDVYERSPLTTTLVPEEEMKSWVLSRLMTSTDDEEEQARAFYERVDRLGIARFAHQRLHLPCIIFPVITLKRDRGDPNSKTEGIRVYCASTDALEESVIRSMERSLLGEELCLVFPWIHDLLATETVYPRRSWEDANNDTDSDSDLDIGELPLHQSPASDTPSDSEDAFPPLPPPPPPRRNRTATLGQFDDRTKTLRCLARLSQPLGAFLLINQGRGLYRRVATDCEIVVRVREGVSLDTIAMRTLEIL